MVRVGNENLESTIVVYHQNLTVEKQMNESQRAKAVLTDSHFLIPVLVFCFGLAVLIALH